ncbi:DoxX family membrane protein [Allomuricauda sp. d1]|uniref:DoxX family membrane protein n=1 Tax=Allomuricauda sp. d1 TaxID=3136725 RepID=UPI0031E3338A
MRIVKLVVFILFGLFMLNSGLNKLFNYMPMPELTEAQIEMFGHFMAIKWLFPLVAVAEIVGGILLMIPKYRALGALVMLPVSTGILLHHVAIEPAGLIIGIVVFAINLWALLDNWGKYKPLFG